MKFGKRLDASLILEWREKYIGYKVLKDQIYLVKRDRDRLIQLARESGYSMAEGWPSEHEIFKLKAAKDYFDMQLRYLKTIEQFYLEQINQATERFYILTEQLIQLGVIGEYTPQRKNRSKKSRKAAHCSVRLAVAEPAPEVDDMLESSFKVIKNLGLLIFNPYGLETNEEPQRDLPLGLSSENVTPATTPKPDPRDPKSPVSPKKKTTLNVASNQLNEKRPTKVEIGLKRAVSVNLLSKKDKEGLSLQRKRTGGKRVKIQHDKLPRELKWDNGGEKETEKVADNEKGKEKEDVSSESPTGLSQSGTVTVRPRAFTTVTKPDSNSTTSNSAEPTTPSPTKPKPVVPRIAALDLASAQLKRTSSLPDVTKSSPPAGPQQREATTSPRRPPPSPRKPASAILKRRDSEAWKKVEGMIGGADEYELEGDEIVVVPIDTSRTSPAKREAQLETLRKAFQEFYRGLFLIVNFSELNGEGFDKAMKKFDKTAKTEQREKFMQKVRKKEFFQAKQLNILIEETENLFCQAFYENDRKGMKSLRMPWEKRSLGWSNFRLGLLSGLSLAVLFLLLYLGIILAGEGDEDLYRWSDVFRVFRFFGLVILMLWLWGVDMWVWTKYRINYAFIFEFNMRSHIEYQQMLEAASSFTVVWMTAFLVYFFSQRPVPGIQWLQQVGWQISPLTLCTLTFAVCIIFQLKSNFWLVKGIARIVGAPFVAVRFRDFFLGDQLCSLVLVFNDLQFTSCFVLWGAWNDESSFSCQESDTYTRPLVAALPFIWRFLQCIRRYRDEGDWHQLANAGKYTSSMAIVLTSTLRGAEEAANAGASTDLFFTWLWLISVMVGTIYTFIWDTRFDWGLGGLPWKFNHENEFLRAKRMYDTRAYYCALVSNLVMRLMWTFTISPSFAVNLFGSYNLALVVLASVEIARRGMWNLFRLEAEQLNNIGKFRAVRDMPLPLPSAKQYHLRVFTT